MRSLLEQDGFHEDKGAGFYRSRINCENETRRALELAGFHEVDLVHLNFLARGDVDLGAYNIIVFPGGFLDGDDLGAAQACANRIRHSRIDGERLIDLFVEFVRSGGLVLESAMVFNFSQNSACCPQSVGITRAET